ncbi:MAG: translation initiation factor IF-2 [Sphingobacteriales bacterium]|nr:translation initiation factor IF-2 [Sphingobacteriales bacterium]
MSEIVAKRLSKVAKEFNIATSTIIDFLKSKNIVIEDNPNSKITPEQYELLLSKFQTDKISKEIIDEKREEVKKEEKIRKPNLQTEEKEDILIKTNLIRDRDISLKEKPIKTEKEKTEIKKESGLKVLGKIEIGEKTQINKEEKEEKKEEIIQEENISVEVEKSVEQEESKVFEEISLEKEENTKTEEFEKKEELILAETEIKVEEPITQTEEFIEEEKDTSESSDERETEEDIETEEHPEIPEVKEETEEFGLKIKGKIDLEQFEPKKKKPVASTSDPATIKHRKRKRIVKNEKVALQEEEKKVKEKTKQKREPKKPEVDEKEIKEQISATLAKLSGKTVPSAKLRVKKLKKREQKEREFSQQEEASNVIEVIEFITVSELANLMNVSVSEVITVCMELGLMVSINQRLDAETIAIVADEFNYEVVFKHDSSTEPSLEEPDVEERMVERAPVVTIMGHVDHGKTTLLDYIRKSKVTEGEAGGITQHIGAYSVELQNGKQITFLDTPGHEAFTSMRARGAKVTDIAIIVIAADDSVMPQTKEAISHAQAAGVKIVFAFNKIDKEGANADRIREQLAEMNILVEEWGGKYQTQEISAKKGINVDKLLDKVLLEAEMLELKADPEKRGVGTIIEASMDKGRGVVATVLVQKGKLKVGDPILAGAYYGKVKALYNETRKRINKAGPSTPVEVIGFDGTPTAGDILYVVESESVAKEIATQRKRLIREQGIRATKHVTLDEIGRRIALGNFKELNIIIKADVDGSVEALTDSIQKLSTEEVQVNVIHRGVGQISESDVLLASASDAIIIGFQVRPSLNARKLAEQEQIDIRLYSVIYDAIEEVKAAIEGMLQPTEEEKILCNVEVREVFRISKVGNIAGCMVLDGKITRNTKIRIVREGVVIYTGELASLKRFKEDVKEVSAGYECGIGIQNFNDLKVGDIIEGFTVEQIKRKL